MKYINSWTTYTPEDVKNVYDFAEDYKDFITNNKTERMCVKSIIKEAKKNGYESLDSIIKSEKKLKAGDKIWAQNHNKIIMLLQVGKQSMAQNGLNILGAHIDAPRIDIKQNPVYEDGGVVMFETHYYGGIKLYQWLNIPMSMYGVIVKKDGTVIDINIGDNPDDPVFFINDLLVHLSYKYVEKPADKFIDPEKIDLLVGSRPLVDGLDVDKNNLKNKSVDKEKIADPNTSTIKSQAAEQFLANFLYENYDVTFDDFESAELEIVPAGQARDCGFDRSMVVGYAQDDRASVYPSLRAMFAADSTNKTTAAIFTDKEEIGSVGPTSMSSKFFENVITEVMELTGEGGMLNCRRALSNSSMISSDVSAAFDPNYPDVFEKNNSCYLGHGLVFNKYGGKGGKYSCNDARAEYCAKIRKICSDAGIVSQSAELGAVGVGGGGTIAYIPANFGMDVIDSGVAVLSMHAPWEVISKADIYEAYKGYTAFLKNA